MAAFNARYVDKDYTLGNYTILAGSTIMMSQYVIHRDPRYCNEPEQFNPDRWSLEAIFQDLVIFRLAEELERA